MSRHRYSWQLVQPGEGVGDRQWATMSCVACGEIVGRALVCPGYSNPICERCVRGAARALEADREGDSWQHPRYGVVVVVSIRNGRLWLGGAWRAVTRDELVADGWERCDPPGAALVLGGEGAAAAAWYLDGRAVPTGTTIELLDGAAWTAVRFEWSAERADPPRGVRGDGTELTLRPTDRFRWLPRSFAQGFAAP